MKLLKLQTAFTHVVTNFEKDMSTIEDCRLVLNNEFFPRLQIFSDFKNFQTFILNNYAFINKGGMLYPAIVAAKLAGKESFDKIVEYIWVKESLNDKPDAHTFKKWLVDFIAYAEEYPEPAVKIQ